jgi:hypothetical protein
MAVVQKGQNSDGGAPEDGIRRGRSRKGQAKSTSSTEQVF